MLPLRSMQSVTGLGLLGMSAVLEDVENFANTHKHIIKRMYTILFNTQSTFMEIVQRHLDIDNCESGTDENFVDESSMSEMRAVVEGITASFDDELEELGVSLPVKSQRSEELSRLLFKLAESTVSEGVDEIVSAMKCVATDEIDQDIGQAMVSGEFTDADQVKENLQQVVLKSSAFIASLEALPFARRLEIEDAQDELRTHVDQLVRRIQMNHVHSPEDLAVVMNLHVFGSSSDSSSEGDSSDEESEETEEEQQVVVSTAKKTGRGRQKKEEAPSKKSTAAKKRKATPVSDAPATASKTRRLKTNVSHSDSSPSPETKPTRRRTRRTTRA